MSERDASRVTAVRKIAVLRANGIGDLVFALPAFEALRATYADAKIVLLGAPWHARFLEDRPGPIDRVLVVPRSRGVNGDERTTDDEGALRTFFEEAAAERFDIALQLHGGGKYSNPFIRRLGARITAGMYAPDASDLDRLVPYVYFQHEVLRYLEVVRLVGASQADIEPRLTVTKADLEEAEAVVPSGPAPLAVLHPGATDTRRRWSATSFAAVGRALAEDGARVVVSGVGEERPAAEEVVGHAGGAATSIVGRLSLGGLAGLLSRAAVVVSNDSGPLHLARAVGAATVGVYWWPNMINAAPLRMARHRTAVSGQTRCPVCGADAMRERCAHSESFVDDIPIDEVKRKALDLLASSSSIATAHGASTERPGTVAGTSW